MTDTPAAPTTQAGRTLRAFACWEFHAFDPNAHNASCGRVHELADGIEAEARATPAEALDVAAALHAVYHGGGSMDTCLRRDEDVLNARRILARLSPSEG